MITVHNQSKWPDYKVSEFHVSGSFAFSFFASFGNHDAARTRSLGETRNETTFISCIPHVEERRGRETKRAFPRETALSLCANEQITKVRRAARARMFRKIVGTPRNSLGRREEQRDFNNCEDFASTKTTLLCLIP